MRFLNSPRSEYHYYVILKKNWDFFIAFFCVLCYVLNFSEQSSIHNSSLFGSAAFRKSRWWNVYHTAMFSRSEITQGNQFLHFLV